MPEPPVHLTLDPSPSTPRKGPGQRLARAQSRAAAAPLLPVASKSEPAPSPSPSSTHSPEESSSPPTPRDSAPPPASAPVRRRILKQLGLSSLSMTGVILLAHGLRGDPHIKRAMSFVDRNLLGDGLRDPRFSHLDSSHPFRSSEGFDPSNYREFLATIPLRYISVHEIVRAHLKSRSGVANQLPPVELWPNIVPTLLLADELRRRLGAPLQEITSAYRSPEYNAKIQGAAEGSYHIQNRALDLKFRCPISRVAEMAHTLRKEGRFKGGIGIYPTFIHLDTRGRNADWNLTPSPKPKPEASV